MKKKSGMGMESEIVASLKSEMKKPRLTESVRNALDAEAAAASKALAARSPRV